jgi:hypothetical protein
VIDRIFTYIQTWLNLLIEIFAKANLLCILCIGLRVRIHHVCCVSERCGEPAFESIDRIALTIEDDAEEEALQQPKIVSEELDGHGYRVWVVQPDCFRSSTDN